jgi:hypothetical protein
LLGFFAVVQDCAAQGLRNHRRSGTGAINKLKAGRTVMRKIVLSMALVVVVGGPAAYAQGGASSVPKNSPQPAIRTTPLEAPIGHRQPRISDVPSENNLSDPNNPVNREDAALDKKIKSICRGC